MLADLVRACRYAGSLHVALLLFDPQFAITNIAFVPLHFKPFVSGANGLCEIMQKLVITWTL